MPGCWSACWIWPWEGCWALRGSAPRATMRKHARVNIGPQRCELS